ncbi:hypothetical protein [Microbacterium sp. HJ5]
MAATPRTSTTGDATITVPPKRTRAVSLGIVIALAFTCTTVGFAVGKLTTPPAATMPGFPGGGFPGGDFPAPPDGGFPGGGELPAPPPQP